MIHGLGSLGAHMLNALAQGGDHRLEAEAEDLCVINLLQRGKPFRAEDVFLEVRFR